MKKIMAVLLSVAVLFAFAACDNSTTNPYFGKQVISVTLADSPDYIEGETINPADIDLRVVFDNGSAVISADTVGLTRTTAAADGEEFKVSSADASAKSIEFKFNYGSYNAFDEDSGLKTWKIQVPVYEVEGLKIGTANAATTVKKDAAEVSLDGLAFSIVYDGTSEKTVSKADLATYGIDLKATATTTTVDAKVKVSVADSGSAALSADKIKLDADWYVTVTEDPATVIKDVAIELDPDYDLFKVDGAGTVNNSLKETHFIVTVTYEDPETTPTEYKGTIDSISPTGVSVAFSEYAGEKLEEEFGKDFAPTTVKAFVTIGDEVYTPTLEMDYTEDYPVAIEASTTIEKFRWGYEFETGDFDYKVTALASGASIDGGSRAATAAEEAKIKVDTESVLIGTTPSTGGSADYPVSFSWTEDVNHTGGVVITGCSVVVVEK